MKTKLKLLAALLLLPILNYQQSTVQAQGTGFTYQGRLNNGANLANGSYNLMFTLFNTNTGGSFIGHPVTNLAVNVNSGLFTVQVDFGPNVFTGATNWLQIAVATNTSNLYTNLTPRQQLTPVPYAFQAQNVSGTITSASLGGTYGNALILSNANNAISGSFAGNGADVTSVNAATLGGIGSAGFWQMNGNTGANPTNGAYLGTADTLPLEFRVNGERGLRLEYATNSDQTFDSSGNQTINVIGGYSGNSVNSGVVGATIGGGGDVGGFPNVITADLGTIGGGVGNTVNGSQATVSGGGGNLASGIGATVPGGVGNTASGVYSFAAGHTATATNDGSFVWADVSEGYNPFYSTNNNSFNVRVAGGARFVTAGAGMTIDGLECFDHG